MFKVLTLNNISPVGLKHFPDDIYEVSDNITNPDAVLVRSQSMLDMALPDSIKVVGRAGAGVNNIPIKNLTAKGVPVLNTPGANANAVRELVIAGMLLASRNICQAWDYVNRLNQSDADVEKQIERDKKQFAGFELLGKTLGVVGLGNVGVKVANAAINLGMKVIGYDPLITVTRAWELSSNVAQARSIEEVLHVSDFVTLHVPLTTDTKNLISSERLMLLQKGAVILNFSRDGIIDNHALAKALREDKIFAYINDFPNPIFQDIPRVISLPHIGASTSEAEENCAVMVVKQIRGFLEEGVISNSVNFPWVEAPNISTGNRISIVNENVPNMVAQISACMAADNLNITSLINKSRDSIAYNLVDVDGDVHDELLSKLGKIHGVVQVRKI